MISGASEESVLRLHDAATGEHLFTSQLYDGSRCGSTCMYVQSLRGCPTQRGVYGILANYRDPAHPIRLTIIDANAAGGAGNNDRSTALPSSSNGASHLRHANLVGVAAGSSPAPQPDAAMQSQVPEASPGQRVCSHVGLLDLNSASPIPHSAWCSDNGSVYGSTKPGGFENRIRVAAYMHSPLHQVMASCTQPSLNWRAQMWALLSGAQRDGAAALAKHAARVPAGFTDGAASARLHSPYAHEIWFESKPSASASSSTPSLLQRSSCAAGSASSTSSLGRSGADLTLAIDDPASPTPSITAVSAHAALMCARVPLFAAMLRNAAVSVKESRPAGASDGAAGAVHGANGAAGGGSTSQLDGQQQHHHAHPGAILLHLPSAMHVTLPMLQMAMAYAYSDCCVWPTAEPPPLPALTSSSSSPSESSNPAAGSSADERRQVDSLLRSLLGLTLSQALGASSFAQQLLGQGITPAVDAMQLQSCTAYTAAVPRSVTAAAPPRPQQLAPSDTNITAMGCASGSSASSSPWHDSTASASAAPLFRHVLATDDRWSTSLSSIAVPSRGPLALVPSADSQASPGDGSAPSPSASPSPRLQQQLLPPLTSFDPYHNRHDPDTEAAITRPHDVRARAKGEAQATSGGSHAAAANANDAGASGGSGAAAVLKAASGPLTVSGGAVMWLGAPSSLHVPNSSSISPAPSSSGSTSASTSAKRSSHTWRIVQGLATAFQCASVFQLPRLAHLAVAQALDAQSSSSILLPDNVVPLLRLAIAYGAVWPSAGSDSAAWPAAPCGSEGVSGDGTGPGSEGMLGLAHRLWLQQCQLAGRPISSAAQPHDSACHLATRPAATVLLFCVFHHCLCHYDSYKAIIPELRQHSGTHDDASSSTAIVSKLSAEAAAAAAPSATSSEKPQITLSNSSNNISTSNHCSGGGSGVHGDCSRSPPTKRARQQALLLHCSDGGGECDALSEASGDGGEQPEVAAVSSTVDGSADTGPAQLTMPLLAARLRHLYQSSCLVPLPRDQSCDGIDAAVEGAILAAANDEEDEDDGDDDDAADVDLDMDDEDENDEVNDDDDDDIYDLAALDAEEGADEDDEEEEGFESAGGEESNTNAGDADTDDNDDQAAIDRLLGDAKGTSTDGSGVEGGADNESLSSSPAIAGADIVGGGALGHSAVATSAPTSGSNATEHQAQSSAAAAGTSEVDVSGAGAGIGRAAPAGLTSADGNAHNQPQSRQHRQPTPSASSIPPFRPYDRACDPLWRSHSSNGSSGTAECGRRQPFVPSMFAHQAVLVSRPVSGMFNAEGGGASGAESGLNPGAGDPSTTTASAAMTSMIILGGHNRLQLVPPRLCYRFSTGVEVEPAAAIQGVSDVCGAKAVVSSTASSSARKTPAGASTAASSPGLAHHASTPAAASQSSVATAPSGLSSRSSNDDDMPSLIPDCGVWSKTPAIGCPPHNLVNHVAAPLTTLASTVSSSSSLSVRHPSSIAPPQPPQQLHNPVNRFVIVFPGCTTIANDSGPGSLPWLWPDAVSQMLVSDGATSPAQDSELVQGYGGTADGSSDGFTRAPGVDAGRSAYSVPVARKVMSGCLPKHTDEDAAVAGAASSQQQQPLVSVPLASTAHQASHVAQRMTLHDARAISHSRIFVFDSWNDSWSCVVPSPDQACIYNQGGALAPPGTSSAQLQADEIRQYPIPVARTSSTMVQWPSPTPDNAFAALPGAASEGPDGSSMYCAAGGGASSHKHVHTRVRTTYHHHIVYGGCWSGEDRDTGNASAAMNRLRNSTIALGDVAVLITTEKTTTVTTTTTTTAMQSVLRPRRDSSNGMDVDGAHAPTVDAASASTGRAESPTATTTSTTSTCSDFEFEWHKPHISLGTSLIQRPPSDRLAHASCTLSLPDAEGGPVMLTYGGHSGGGFLADVAILALDSDPQHFRTTTEEHAQPSHDSASTADDANVASAAVDGASCSSLGLSSASSETEAPSTITTTSSSSSAGTAGWNKHLSFRWHKPVVFGRPPSGRYGHTITSLHNELTASAPGISKSARSGSRDEASSSASANTTAKQLLSALHSDISRRTFIIHGGHGRSDADDQQVKIGRRVAAEALASSTAASGGGDGDGLGDHNSSESDMYRVIGVAGGMASDKSLLLGDAGRLGFLNDLHIGTLVRAPDVAAYGDRDANGGTGSASLGDRAFVYVLTWSQPIMPWQRVARNPSIRIPPTATMPSPVRSPIGVDGGDSVTRSGGDADAAATATTPRTPSSVNKQVVCPAPCARERHSCVYSHTWQWQGGSSGDPARNGIQGADDPSSPAVMFGGAAASRSLSPSAAGNHHQADTTQLQQQQFPVDEAAFKRMAAACADVGDAEGAASSLLAMTLPGAILCFGGRDDGVRPQARSEGIRRWELRRHAMLRAALPVGIDTSSLPIATAQPGQSVTPGKLPEVVGSNTLMAPGVARSSADTSSSSSTAMQAGDANHCSSDPQAGPSRQSNAVQTFDEARLSAEAIFKRRLALRLHSRSIELAAERALRDAGAAPGGAGAQQQQQQHPAILPGMARLAALHRRLQRRGAEEDDADEGDENDEEEAGVGGADGAVVGSNPPPMWDENDRAVAESLDRGLWAGSRTVAQLERRLVQLHRGEHDHSDGAYADSSQYTSVHPSSVSGACAAPSLSAASSSSANSPSSSVDANDELRARMRDAARFEDVNIADLQFPLSLRLGNDDEWGTLQSDVVTAKALSRPDPNEVHVDTNVWALRLTIAPDVRSVLYTGTAIADASAPTASSSSSTRIAKGHGAGAADAEMGGADGATSPLKRRLQASSTPVAVRGALGSLLTPQQRRLISRLLCPAPAAPKSTAQLAAGSVAFPPAFPLPPSTPPCARALYRYVHHILAERHRIRGLLQSPLIGRAPGAPDQNKSEVQLPSIDSLRRFELLLQLAASQNEAEHDEDGENGGDDAEFGGLDELLDLRGFLQRIMEGQHGLAADERQQFADRMEGVLGRLGGQHAQRHMIRPAAGARGRGHSNANSGAGAGAGGQHPQQAGQASGPRSASSPPAGRSPPAGSASASARDTLAGGWAPVPMPGELRGWHQRKAMRSYAFVSALDRDHDDAGAGMQGAVGAAGADTGLDNSGDAAVRISWRSLDPEFRDRLSLLADSYGLIGSSDIDRHHPRAVASRLRSKRERERRMKHLMQYAMRLHVVAEWQEVRAWAVDPGHTIPPVVGQRGFTDANSATQVVPGPAVDGDESAAEPRGARGAVPEDRCYHCHGCNHSQCRPNDGAHQYRHPPIPYPLAPVPNSTMVMDIGSMVPGGLDLALEGARDAAADADCTDVSDFASTGHDDLVASIAAASGSSFSDFSILLAKPRQVSPSSASSSPLTDAHAPKPTSKLVELGRAIIPAHSWLLQARCPMVTAIFGSSIDGDSGGDAGDGNSATGGSVGAAGSSSSGTSNGFAVSLGSSSGFAEAASNSLRIMDGNDDDDNGSADSEMGAGAASGAISDMEEGFTPPDSGSRLKAHRDNVIRLLHYLYTDCLHPNMPPEAAMAMLVMAGRYSLPRLASLAEALLISHLDADNVCGLLQFADEYCGGSSDGAGDALANGDGGQRIAGANDGMAITDQHAISTAPAPTAVTTHAVSASRSHSPGTSLRTACISFILRRYRTFFDVHDQGVEAAPAVAVSAAAVVPSQAPIAAAAGSTITSGPISHRSAEASDVNAPDAAAAPSSGTAIGDHTQAAADLSLSVTPDLASDFRALPQHLQEHVRHLWESQPHAYAFDRLGER